MCLHGAMIGMQARLPTGIRWQLGAVTTSVLGLLSSIS